MEGTILRGIGGFYTVLSHEDRATLTLRPQKKMRRDGMKLAVGDTVVFSRINEEDLPRPLRGAPIVLIAAALMSIAFTGFSGLSF